LSFKFADLSQDHQDSDFQSIFSNTGLPGSINLSSLSAESSEICRFVRLKIGEPVLTVELDNSQIDMAFEEASLEYSRILTMQQIENQYSNILGLSKDYTNHNINTRLPVTTFNFLKKYTENYGAYGPTPVGGNFPIRKGYVLAQHGQQEYNINNELYDNETNLTLASYRNQTSLSANGAGIRITKLHYQQPTSLYRYFDPSSNYNLLADEFKFESFTTGGGNLNFQIMPVWNDILRGQIFKESDLVRRSNYSYNLFSDRLILYPSPKSSIKIYFEWFLDPDPFDPNIALSGSSAYLASLTGGVINSPWSVPTTDITYDAMNSMARQWVRQYTVALCKEMLGLIRNKFNTVAIPNGDVTLNGDALIQQGREDQEKLKETLRTELEPFKKENMMEKEQKMAESAYNTLKFFPLGGPVVG
jgi:hypothetical protein